jgi:1,4-alpha-glucan branching enzyme
VAVANFSDNLLAGYQVPNFPVVGTWQEWTGNCDIEAGEDGLTIDIGGYEAKMLVWFPK